MQTLYTYTNADSGVTHIGPVSFVPERADATVKFFVHFSTDANSPKLLYLPMNQLRELNPMV
jgi:hypothetical protein